MGQRVRTSHGTCGQVAGTGDTDLLGIALALGKHKYIRGLRGVWQQASGGRSLRDCGRVPEQQAPSKHVSQKCRGGQQFLCLTLCPALSA